MRIETLESRQMLSFDFDMPPVRLLADGNRDGVVDSLDESGNGGRGAIVLPNCDRDNTTTGAPDNWTGGVWNGTPVAPNNIVDNSADLRDLGELRLRKLGNIDNWYDYRVTLELLNPKDDPEWLEGVNASDRVRLFFPTREKTNGNVVCQPGDAAIFGPGQATTIRFVTNPSGANEYSMQKLVGNGDFIFGVEGIKAGAVVRFRMTIEYVPIIISSEPPVDVPSEDIPTVKDVVTLRVAPFVVATNQQSASKVFIENMNRYNIDNSDVRAAMKDLFGDRFVESRTGDLWLQDGFEVGYAQAPYGSMPVILELPRAQDVFFDMDHNIRSFIREKLLKPGVGVNIELAAHVNDSGSAYGGDIESLPQPGQPAGRPGFLIASDMPEYMQDFFEAQDVNPMLDLKIDEWLGVGHVDEVVHLAHGGEKVIIADPDIAWALSLWALKLDKDARAFPEMNSNSTLPDYTAEGIKMSFLLSNKDFRRQNLEYVQSDDRLKSVYEKVKNAMNLTREVFTPRPDAANKGSAVLEQGGAFTQMLNGVKRTFEIRFRDGDRYQLRYRDAGGEASNWFSGRKSRDEVFPEARAFLLKHYWTGQAKEGDRFTFKTNPNATLIKMPVLFGSFGLFHEGPGEGPWRLAAFSTNHINSLSDGDTILTGKAYGPKVNWNGTGKSDLLQSYVKSVFRSTGYGQIVFADSRVYHDSGGGLHCGTNAIRDVPAAPWWNA